MEPPDMKPIVTLTLNPCIDSAAEAERVQPVHKIRTSNERYYPGGGGVNVARVLAELGAPALPVYLAGGATGALLDQLMAERGFAPRSVRIRDNTRISHAVYERATGLEYRFVPEGPVLDPEDWPRCRALIEGLDFDWLVASGSLPRGAPVDCYAELARLCAARGARFVLDSSGPALAAALGAGPVHLLKPSLGEFRALTGAPLETPAEIDAAAAALRARGVELVAVTLGQDGALLADAEGVVRRTPPPVEARSATGAGDSFLGGFVYALAEGRAPREAFALAVAAGAASVLTPGTELCRRDDVLRLAALAG
jgi:6-phosphofructokinase 2